MTAAADRIHSSANALVRLAMAYSTGDSLQYDRPVGPSTRGEADEQAKGGVSRPTEDIATDERRLRLRAAVLEAEDALEIIATNADEIADRLEARVREWAGERY